MKLPSALPLRRAVVLPLILALGGSVTTLSGQSPAADDNGAASASSAQTTSSAADPVVLKMGTTRVTRSQFEAIVATLRTQQDAEDEPVQLRTLGENYASMLALSQLASEHHLDATPEVQRQLALDRTQILSNAEYARLLEQTQPTAADVSEYYNAHTSDYEQVQVRRLFIWKRAPGSKATKGVSPEEAQALAGQIQQAVAGGGDINKLVSGNESVVFDISPLTFPRGELPPYMEQPAFSMQPGEWRTLEDKPDALIQLQLVKRETRPLNIVKPLIEKKLHTQKMLAALDKVNSNAGIWLDPQYFAADAGEPKSTADTSAASRAQENPKSEAGKEENHD